MSPGRPKHYINSNRRYQENPISSRSQSPLKIPSFDSLTLYYIVIIVMKVEGSQAVIISVLFLSMQSFCRYSLQHFIRASESYAFTSSL